MGQFQRRVISGVFLVLAVGCGQPQEEYRTYSESRDGEAVSPTVATETAPSQPATHPSTDAAAQPANPASIPPSGNSPPDAGRSDSTASSTPMPGAEPTAGPATAAPTSETNSPDIAASTAALRPPRAPLPERIALLGTSNASTGDQPGTPGSPDSPSAEPRPAGIQLLIPEKEFSRVGANGPLRVSYDDIDLLKVLNMEPVPADCAEYFPDWLKSLNGAEIRIRGFMLPPNRETGLPAFQLARDNQICCFGRDPKVYDLFPVTLKEGTTTNYIPNRPFDVVGRFHIRPDVYRGELLNLYEIEDAEIITR